LRDWIAHIANDGAFSMLADFAVFRTWFSTNPADVEFVFLGGFGTIALLVKIQSTSLVHIAAWRFVSSILFSVLFVVKVQLRSSNVTRNPGRDLAILFVCAESTPLFKIFGFFKLWIQALAYFTI
jgi:hypothetical protein